jgi:hypothetical protein
VIRLGTELQTDTQLLQPARALAFARRLRLINEVRKSVLFDYHTCGISHEITFTASPSATLQERERGKRSAQIADGHKPISRPLLCV